MAGQRAQQSNTDAGVWLGSSGGWGRTARAARGGGESLGAGPSAGSGLERVLCPWPLRLESLAVGTWRVSGPEGEPPHFLVRFPLAVSRSWRAWPLGDPVWGPASCLHCQASGTKGSDRTLRLQGGRPWGGLRGQAEDSQRGLEPTGPFGASAAQVPEGPVCREGLGGSPEGPVLLRQGGATGPLPLPAHQVCTPHACSWGLIPSISRAGCLQGLSTQTRPSAVTPARRSLQGQPRCLWGRGPGPGALSAAARPRSPVGPATFKSLGMGRDFPWP